MAVPMAQYGCERYFAADAITDLLSAGKAARFNSRLVYGSAQDSSRRATHPSSVASMKDLCLFSPSLPIAAPRRSTVRHLLSSKRGRRLSAPGEISPRELQRCYNNYESTFRFSNLGYLSRATNLALAEYHGEDINRNVDDRRALSVETIPAEADRLFNRTPFVRLDYIPQ